MIAAAPWRALHPQEAEELLPHPHAVGEVRVSLEILPTELAGAMRLASESEGGRGRHHQPAGAAVLSPAARAQPQPPQAPRPAPHGPVLPVLVNLC